jgi:GTP-binding protein YchF
MKVGIVGLPNAGKSSLFSALTGVAAEAANYPFTTIEPNVAVVPVADERLDAVARTVGASKVVPDTITFHDIAGLVAGAHRGEGLGNQFLANIRETDAIVHVIRVHQDPNVVHPEGRVEPLADVETIETELIYADLEQAERRLERVARTAKSGDRHAVAEEGWLRELIEALQAGRPARTVSPPTGAPDAVTLLQPLTAKPVLYVANVDEGSTELPPELQEYTRSLGAAAVAVSARVEAELAELDPEEAAAMRAELGLSESGPGEPGVGDSRGGESGGGGARGGESRPSESRLGKSGVEAVIRGAFALLDQIAFFTAGEDKPAQSWHLQRGLSAWHAAGMIHSDIQRGFVRAEVISWRELVDAGGYAAARERGTLRLEGRDYIVADGDVITVKFTP